MIETERLLLRLPDDSDIDAWTAMLADPEVTRYLGPPIDCRDAVATHIRTIRERHEADGFGLLAVQRKDDGRVIGRSGFLVWDRRTWTPTTLRDAGKHAEIEIGWTLVRACWGCGYATEAGKACRDHGFANLGANRVAAVIQHSNQRSIAVARRLEMTPEQEIRTGNGFEAQLWIATRGGVGEAPGREGAQGRTLTRSL
jgi:RimJ/RimL family protein N-acetyltransferase